MNYLFHMKIIDLNSYHKTFHGFIVIHLLPKIKDTAMLLTVPLP